MRICVLFANNEQKTGEERLYRRAARACAVERSRLVARMMSSPHTLPAPSTRPAYRARPRWIMYICPGGAGSDGASTNSAATQGQYGTQHHTMMAASSR